MLEKSLHTGTRIPPHLFTPEIIFYFRFEGFHVGTFRLDSLIG